MTSSPGIFGLTSASTGDFCGPSEPVPWSTSISFNAVMRIVRSFALLSRRKNRHLSCILSSSMTIESSCASQPCLVMLVTGASRSRAARPRHPPKCARRSSPTGALERAEDGLLARDGFLQEGQQRLPPLLKGGVPGAQAVRTVRFHAHGRGTPARQVVVLREVRAGC